MVIMQATMERGATEKSAPLQQHSKENYSLKTLTLTLCKEEARLDTRLLAKHLGNTPKAIIKLVDKHKQCFSELGKVVFEISPLPSGQRERYGALNEDQCYLVLTFSRNTAKVKDLKVKMVKVFGEARKARELRHTEYLPTYHQLHDQIKVLADGSPNEQLIHMNFNKLLNKVSGIKAGMRSMANLPTQSLLIVAQLMTLQAMQSASDHKDGYALAKDATMPLLALTAGNVLQLKTP
ncbi:conserved hypothetical protein [Candidatus Nitrotoga sp. BS]|uniref:Bro-N domain-containing protein n=1 Tax=Candidatus Nitrotoga sp. BS TaxID=2890408 RepID=UPI001EF18912|nr:Bro-N domain-containing protein [Candidatus Nitrotoga sp. BS]CAH1207473.1 conserved hypothetical protein [Candidatus Nitrotoga sp. BS]